MENELWIARDKPMEGSEKGDVIIYGHEPARDDAAGVFIPGAARYGDMMFFECCDTTDMVILNPDAFPDVTWENSPQKLTLNDTKQLKS